MFSLIRQFRLIDGSWEGKDAFRYDKPEAGSSATHQTKSSETNFINIHVYTKGFI